MKTVISIIFILVVYCTYGQKVIQLDIKQPPEFGFSVSNQDTTIVRGGSVVLGTDLTIFGGSGQYSFSWTPATTLSDSTTMNPLAFPTDTTVYLLTVSDNMGCSFSLNYKVNVREKMVNIQNSETVGELDVLLFPNPNDGVFKVKLSGKPLKKIELLITDISGKLIHNQVISDFSGEYTEMMQLQLVSGIYTLSVRSENTKLIRQFIIN